MNDGLHHERAYFEAMFSNHIDPWGFDRRWYERRKYAITIACLPEPRYERAFEPGCANGALTELLAERCDHIVASELVASVAARAAHRMADRAGVSIVVGEFPLDWPDGDGDLVIWSEIAYYLTDAGSRQALDGLAAWLRPGGDLVAVHWLGETDYPRRGEEIAPWIDRVPWLHRRAHLRDTQFELGVWRREA